MCPEVMHLVASVIDRYTINKQLISICTFMSPVVFCPFMWSYGCHLTCLSCSRSLKPCHIIMKNISSVLIHFLCQGVPVRSSCWCHDGDGWNLWSVWGRWRTQLIIAWSRWGRLKTSWCGTCPYSNTLIVNTHHIRGCRWICEGRLHFIQDHRVHDFHRWKLHQEGTLMQTVFITCYHANKSPYLQCYHFSLGLWWWY